MWLGIDLGTSGVKAVVLDEAGVVIAQHSAPLAVSRPHPLWSEQDPEDWWAATDAAINGLPPKIRGKLLGIGLAGQMHGATLLGADSRPLRPAILWNDGRSSAECVELESQCLDLRSITGNIAMPGFTAPKLAWVRKHEPEVFDRVRKVLLPKDYVRLRMTGDFASDLSDSAGTLWLDVAKRNWSAALLDACGLTLDHMPQLHEGPDPTGTLRADLAASWGMDPIPVVAGGGDNAAGAIGVGAIRDGDALLSLGTSGVIFVATQSFRPNPARAIHTFCHALPGLWHQMSVTLSAASCIDWAARITGARDAAEVFASAEIAGPNAGGETFLPYLSGERTPHNDPTVRGAFLHLDHETDAGRMRQAVLEGVAFALADGADALRQTGTRIDQMSVIGGGARSRYWGRLIASALNTRLLYCKDGDVGPALGAARLAAIGIGGNEVSDVCAAPPTDHIVEPQPALQRMLAEKRARFQAGYAHIHPTGVAA